MCEILVSPTQIHLRNRQISYVMGILQGGVVMHQYFGARVEAFNPSSALQHARIPDGAGFSTQECTLDHTPQEYPSFGLGDMRPGALTVRREDGTASTDLRFVSAQVQHGVPKIEGLPGVYGNHADTLLLMLEDKAIGLTATLFYTMFDDCDAIVRSVCLKNGGKEHLTVESAMSLCMDMPDSNFDVLTLSGSWSREREMVRRPLTFGEQSVSTFRGASSLQTSPFLGLLRPETTENTGDVFGFSLIYSGNFYAGAQVDQNRTTRVMLGLHDMNFAWELDPGEAFQTPEAVAVFSTEGLNGMSRHMHCICAEHLVRGDYAHKPRPILINNWEATYFHFNEQKLLALAQAASQVGIELFVLDDGWFGKRDDDTTSLGDWTVDSEKLPHGLSGLADAIHALGMKFGLWFEPEMISPKSHLFQDHPDWCVQVSGRENIECRHQLVLDLSRKDVCEHVYHAVADILCAHPIDYVKWDMNRNFTNIGSLRLKPQQQRSFAHRYMLGLYDVLERLTTRFPHVLFESCAGGGGRFDMGMLAYMPQTWCSDNTDAKSRVLIQYSTSLVFPPFSMGAHVSAVPNHQTGRITPLASRGNVAMSGCFGYELDLTQMTPTELEEIAQQVRRVKQLRNTLQFGTLLRLQSPYEHHDAAWMSVSPDRGEAIVVFFRMQGLSNEHPPVLRLRGLDSASDYVVEETGEIYSGSQLMNDGLCMALPQGDAASVSYVLHRITEESRLKDKNDF